MNQKQLKQLDALFEKEMQEERIKACATQRKDGIQKRVRV